MGVKSQTARGSEFIQPQTLLITRDDHLSELSKVKEEAAWTYVRCMEHI